MSNLLDSYLLFRIKARQDPEAYGQLYDRYVGAMYRFAILKLPTQEDAQDVTAEVFTRAWQYLCESTEPVGNFRALIYKIARNLIADKYRQSGRTVSFESVTFEGAEPSTYIDAEQSDRGRQAEVAIARADLALLLTKLERLKEDYRDVLTLRLIDDLPFAVVAEIMGKTTGHVRVIFHRAMSALNELVEPENET